MTRRDRPVDGPAPLDLGSAAAAMAARAGAMAAGAPTAGPVVDERAAWFDAMVPPRLGSPRLDPDDPIDAMLAAWALGAPRSLILTGPVGSGKSHRLWAALRVACLDAGRSVSVVNVPRMLRDLRPDGAGVDLRALARVGIAGLDDLGAERPSDWTAEQLYTLVDDRWEQARPIAVTSNLTVGPTGSLVEGVGERVYSRLVDGALVVRITGEDRRRSRR